MVFQAPPLDDEEIAVLAKIAELSAGLRLRLLETDRSLTSLARIQFARAIHGSSSIEGFEVALDDATAIDLGEPPIDADDAMSLAVKGYRDALTYVSHLSTDDDFDYSAQLLKSLHFIMESFDVRGHPGRWRVGPAPMPTDEATQSAYVAPSARDVPTLMHEFVDSLRTTDGSPALIRAAIAHLNLVTIQPFETRNGRIGRCCHTLVLARQGVLAPAFASIEEYLARNNLIYADVLANVAGGSYQPERDTRPWIRFMLTAHLRQAQTLKRRVNEHGLIWDRLEKMVASRGLPERSIVALFDAALGLRIRSTTYRAALDHSNLEVITEATASRDLRQLAEDGLLDAVGEKRGRHYVATSEVEGFRQAITSARKKKDKTDPFARREKHG